MVASKRTLTHLLSCFDAVYRGLGESAPLFSGDANVVRVHEMSRSFGDVALEIRESSPTLFARRWLTTSRVR
jgi:hypothetical protein